MSQRFGSSGKSKGLMLVVSLCLAFAMLLSVQIVLAYDPAGFTIDSFVESLELVAKGSTPPAIYTYTTADAVSGIIGNQVDVEIENSANDGGALRQIRATSSSGSFSYAADDSVRGWARLTWDGQDNNAQTLAPTGLSGADVTNGSLSTGFHIRLSSDHPATLTLSVYSDGTNWSAYTFAVPNTANAKQSFFIPFGSFVTQGGTGAAMASVGAIVLYVDGTDGNSAGLDLTLDFVETNSTDLGDDPNSSYGTLLNSSGARHVLGVNFLGALVDAELDGQPTVGADGDDINGDDEDGVVRYQNWSQSTVYVRVYYTQAVYGCLNGWLDWWNGSIPTSGPDGDFNDTFERIIGTDAAPGGVAISQTTDYTISVFFGSNVLNFNNDYYARFRVTPDEDNDGDCSTADTHAPQQSVGPTGTAFGGEVEDYFWQFGPTAVTLNRLEAKADAQNNTAALILAATVVAALGLAGVALRRRTA